MSGQRELDSALNIITKSHSNISILHCVSQYPTNPINLNLKNHTFFKRIIHLIKSDIQIIL